MRHVIFISFFPRTSSVGGGGIAVLRCQTFSVGSIFLFSRPRAGLTRRVPRRAGQISIGMYQSKSFFFTKHLPIKAMRRQPSKFTKGHTTQHTRRRMRPSGGRTSGARTKNRTVGARSGPPVGHRQPRPPY